MRQSIQRCAELQFIINMFSVIQASMTDHSPHAHTNTHTHTDTSPTTATPHQSSITG